MAVFAHGQFYGAIQIERIAGSFSLKHALADRPAHDVDIHTHQDAHIVLVTGGDYISSARGEPDDEAPLIYNPPGTTHRDCFHRGLGSFLAISIPVGLAIEIVRSDMAAHLTGRMRRCLARSILRESASGGEEMILDALCLELLAAIGAADDAFRLPPPWLGRAYELLNDRFTEELHIGEIARAIGVHPVHLARAYRRHYRSTPGDHLRARRLERAASLLTATAAALADVAIQAGFSDQSHMTRSFGQVFGVTPARYRRLVGGDVSSMQDGDGGNIGR
jgi:AraC family transcriptional regulator